MFLSKLSMTSGQIMQLCHQPKNRKMLGFHEMMEKRGEKKRKYKEEKGKKRKWNGEGRGRRRKGRREELFLSWASVPVSKVHWVLSLCLPFLCSLHTWPCAFMDQCTIVCACVGVRCFLCVCEHMVGGQGNVPVLHFSQCAGPLCCCIVAGLSFVPQDKQIYF